MTDENSGLRDAITAVIRNLVSYDQEEAGVAEILRLVEQHHHCASCDMHACGDLSRPVPDLSAIHQVVAQVEAMGPELAEFKEGFREGFAEKRGKQPVVTVDVPGVARLMREHLRELGPGVFLSDRKHLAGEYAATVEAMGEVLRMLRAEGLVELGEGGCYVTAGTPIPDPWFQAWRRGIAVEAVAKGAGFPVSVLAKDFRRKMRLVGREKIILFLYEKGIQWSRVAIERSINESRLRAGEALDGLVRDGLVVKGGFATRPSYVLTEAGRAEAQRLMEEGEYQ